MFPKLFDLPFVHLTIWSYGPMIVIGFLAATFLLRKTARKIGENPDHVTNAALYSLIAGLIGARVFYVLHHLPQFRSQPLSVFSVWNGGLEFVGGLVFAIVVVVLYMLRRKLPVRRYIDLLAIALMLALSFGRIGCFLHGCCFGKPTDLAWAVRFPYASPAYQSQSRPDNLRKRAEPYFKLPAEYFGFSSEDGKMWLPTTDINYYAAGLMPLEHMTKQEKHEVTRGRYRCLAVHPTQLYSSANAFVLFLLLYLFWKKFGVEKPGCTFAMMFILYGPTRFAIEFLRDDNPFEYAWWMIYKGGTVSQNIGLYLTVLGLLLLAVNLKIRTKKS